MILQKIEIEQFAGLKNYVLELKPGFQYIYGANEAGKSTLCAFLSVMFYGMPHKVRAGGLRGDSRKLYMPWGESYMAGTVSFIHDNKSYVLKRRFGQTARSDKCTLYTGSDWQEIFILPENIGHRFLGVGEDAFYKTLFISQSGAAIEKGKEDELVTRLSNLEETGEEDASLQKALNELTRAKHDLVSKSGQAGALPKLLAEEEALRAELAKVLEQHESFRELLSNIQVLTREQTETEQQILALKEQSGKAAAYEAYLSQQREAAKRREILQEKLQAEEKLLETERALFETSETYKTLAPVAGLEPDILLTLAQKEAEIRKLKEQLADAEVLQQDIVGLEAEMAEKTPPFKWSVLISGVFLLLIGVFGGIVLSPFFYFLALVGASLGAMSFIRINGQERARQAELSAKRESWAQQLQKIMAQHPEEKLGALKEELLQVFRQTDTDSVNALANQIEAARKCGHRQDVLRREFEQLKLRITQLDELIETLPAETEEIPSAYEGPSTETLTQTIEQANNRLRRYEQELAAKKALTEKGFQGLRSVAVIENDLALLVEKKAELTFSYEAISRAEAILTQCAEELKQTFAPALNEASGKLIERLSGGRYREVRITDTYQMMLKSPNGAEIVEAEYVSAGTWDLLYFALRLALVDTLFDSAPLLVLDDTFIQLDAGRQKQAFSLLCDNSAEQILYFSCHEPPAFCKENQLIHL